jgi:DNA-binding MarR family transcriptional regulator
MNQKQIGVMLILIGIVLAGLVQVSKAREDYYIKELMLKNASCFLEDGTCLHADRDLTPYIAGWILSAMIFSLGVYLVFFDRTQKELAESQMMLSRTLEEVKKQDRIKDEFGAFLSGFSEDEKKVIKAIHEQEGIRQSTLRYRIDMSKSTLSLMLASLEKRGIISKKESGKTNELFLVKKF